jgi:hypothetical protein
MRCRILRETDSVEAVVTARPRISFNTSNCSLRAQCFSSFRMIPTPYFSKITLTGGLCRTETAFFLWGRNWLSVQCNFDPGLIPIQFIRIYGRRNSTKKGFSSSNLVFTCQYNSGLWGGLKRVKACMVKGRVRNSLTYEMHKKIKYKGKNYWTISGKQIMKLHTRNS